MRTLSVIMLLTFGAFSAKASIIPERSVYSFLDIFNRKNEIQDQSVTVKATAYDQNGDLTPGKKFDVSLSPREFEKYKSEASAVLEGIPFKHRNDDMFFLGTAFHIGHNLILTNNHVLSVDFSNGAKCDGFKIKNHRGKTFSCQQVHYCNKKEDLCLIEIAPRKTGIFGSGREELADLPALKLNALPVTAGDDVLVTSIGNSQGHGIHVSVARGLSLRGNALTVYTSIRNGNSGGPVLNEAGEVIGVVRTENMYVKLEGGKNSVVPIRALRYALRNSAHLADIEQAIRRSGGDTTEPDSQAVVLVESVKRHLAENSLALEDFLAAVPKAGARGENHAASTRTIVKLIREALQDRPETLGKFNQSVIE